MVGDRQQMLRDMGMDARSLQSQVDMDDVVWLSGDISRV